VGGRATSSRKLHPDDFDGILAGAPAFNWTRFITSELYPQIVYQAGSRRHSAHCEPVEYARQLRRSNCLPTW